MESVDNMCMSVASGQPPAAKYVQPGSTKAERKYNTDLKKIWYIES